ncbi:possible ABC transporter [Prochlorococcus marinus subsp. pastoris str. CCMP1986]|jgi:putative ABC transport system permease protein|uniref:Possible ABC transporter n=1 Tax=Prochlorococcus marinus subsp. pastoris (strain CCMP1986 / NIES-2087 / MED4) TaxID=59919 RepID=Q7V1G0_PROMP|nr:ABC transporter permease [Prochlorococcus marinus]MDC3036905.1 ABC transporter permease [Prochlorococcus sp. AH-716-O22]MDC3164048.1 ABC transporter permease [Prochlorococcus sp. AH-716-F13]RCL49013.1 MAG: ABC transporter permease [Prochlorococcus sp. MED-G72]KGF87523.1 Cell division protein FtsX [Prochlorococcus marinus str. EQPAC1]CAE19372.1 possible ABC transporter [Prochlorococcus marinus subsp. pastoris str. CCMP1986]
MSRNISLKEAFNMAGKTLVSNKLRSSLTMLGIIIGNASVITLVGLGRGAQTLAKNQLSNLGANVLFIVPGNNDTRRRGISFPKNLVLEDSIAINNQVPSVKKVAPQISANEIVQSNSKSLNISIAGVTPEFLDVRSFEVDEGRFISQSDVNSARSFVVIGPDLKEDFFKGNTVIGEKIRIKDHTYEIIGILKPKGAVFGSNQDKNAYIPLTTMVNRISGKDPTYGVSLSFISVEATSKNKTSAAKFQITNLLRQRHNIVRDDDFAVRSQEDALNIVTNITSGLTFLLAGIGAVSLIVGGIGIMNIMLVSVSERTEEIGLRKAIGAKQSDILIQFLFEALILSTIGGLVGTTTGLTGVFLLGVITPLPASVGITTTLSTMIISGSIGLIFGVLPAKRASQLDPIVALRSL